MNRYFGVHVLDGEWHALLPRYLVLADRVRDRRILDIGCGTGIGSSLLLELGADRVDGIDYRPGVLDLAEIKHAKESLDFHTMLWEDLEFDEDTFDLVVCLDPSTPVTDPNMLEEVTRVLRPDGEYVCAIERRTIDGVESLLPKYGYSSPAENVELGDRDERAPQIGELTNYFEQFHRVLQRPTYNYTFEVERAESSGEPEAGPVDETLCTEDSHIAGVEMIYCGSSSLDEPEDRTVRLPYYRLVERLGTVIRDLNVRQGPDREEPLGGPVEEGEAGDEGLASKTSPEVDGTDWDGDDASGAPDMGREATNEGTRDELGTEVRRLTDAYQELRHNFEQLRHQTQSAMVEQERSIGQLVQVLRRWYEETAEEDWPPASVEEEVGAIEPMDEPRDVDERATTDVYDSPDEEEAEDRDPAEKIEALEHELEARNSYIEELERKVDRLADSDSLAEESSDAAEEAGLGEASSSETSLEEDSSDPESLEESTSDVADD